MTTHENRVEALEVALTHHISSGNTHAAIVVLSEQISLLKEMIERVRVDRICGRGMEDEKKFSSLN